MVLLRKIEYPKIKWFLKRELVAVDRNQTAHVWETYIISYGWSVGWLWLVMSWLISIHEISHKDGWYKPHWCPWIPTFADVLSLFFPSNTIITTLITSRTGWPWWRFHAWKLWCRGQLGISSVNDLKSSFSDLWSPWAAVILSSVTHRTPGPGPGKGINSESHSSQLWPFISYKY